MRRREFITLLSGAATWPLGARAQQPGAVKRIGFLRTSAENDPGTEANLTAFRQELQRLGWTVGRNLQINERAAAGDDSKLRALAAELVGENLDLILSNGTQATAILKQLTGTIPIVFVNVADPVASSPVASFPPPGGNITGVTSLEFSLGSRWLSILKDIPPGVSRVLVLYNSENPNWSGFL